MQVLFKRFDATQEALFNKRPTSDAGWDLFAMEDITFDPMEIKKVQVNLAIALPNYVQTEVEIPPGPEGSAGRYYTKLNILPYALIAGRSSMNSNGWLCYPGVVDQGYRGQLAVILQNTTPVGYWDRLKAYVFGADLPTRTIKKGQRIAQLMFLSAFVPELTEVDKLPSSDRGEGGFGSSGK